MWAVDCVPETARNVRALVVLYRISRDASREFPSTRIGMEDKHYSISRPKPGYAEAAAGLFAVRIADDKSDDETGKRSVRE